MNASSFARRCAALALVFSAALSAQPGAPGAPDPSFGVGGRRLLDFHGGSDQVNAVAPLKDGRFLAAGSIHGPNASGPGFSGNVGVVRFLADGRVDTSFGQAGLFQLDIDSGFDEAHALRVQPDGRIVVAGALTASAYSDFAILRLRPDGTLDTGFGAQAGRTTLDIGGATVHDEALAVAMQSDGRYIVAGITRVPFGGFTYRRVAVARFTAQGLIDTSFGAGTGYVILEPFFAGDADDGHVALALTPGERLPADDRITIAGFTTSRNNAFVARLTASGQVDTSFGTPVGGGLRSGRITLSAATSGGVPTGVSTIRAARIVAGGRIVIAGSGNDRGFTFMRLLPDGTLDATFGSAGRTTVKLSDPSQYDEPFALDVQGNGKLVAAGYASTGGTNTDFFFVRLTAAGAPDASFGDGQGRALVPVSASADQALALAVEPSGRLLAGGYATAASGSNGSDFALARVFGDADRIFFHDYELPPPD